MPADLDSAIAHFRAMRFDEAAADAMLLAQQNPGNIPALTLLGEAMYSSGHIAEAARVFQQVLAIAPSAYVKAGLAMTLTALGQRAEAKAMVISALEDDPEMSRAWTALIDLHRFRKDDPLLKKAKRIFKRDGVHPETKRSLAYVMVKAMNDSGKYDRAWDWATKAHEVSPPGDVELLMPDMGRQMAQTFDREFLAPRPGRGSDSTLPVFVVGMPRSGTTLMERILAASPDVAAIGEFSGIMDISTAAREAFKVANPEAGPYAFLRHWNDAAITKAAEIYLGQIARRAGRSSRYCVDKTPANILHLYLIACLFPQAKIIRMHRDPLDTCVSCFLNNFGHGHSYTRRVDWLAYGYRVTQQAGDVQAQLIPNPMLDVSYEALVQSPEAESQRIYDFVGLDWSADVLNTTDSTHITNTRSVDQVRAPISARSVGRWRRYRNRISPLAEALGIDIADDAAA